jgi:hypothetical protein
MHTLFYFVISNTPQALEKSHDVHRFLLPLSAGRRNDECLFPPAYRRQDSRLTFVVPAASLPSSSLRRTLVLHLTIYHSLFTIHYSLLASHVFTAEPQRNRSLRRENSILTTHHSRISPHIYHSDAVTQRISVSLCFCVLSVEIFIQWMQISLRLFLAHRNDVWLFPPACRRQDSRLTIHVSRSSILQRLIHRHFKLFGDISM